MQGSIKSHNTCSDIRTIGIGNRLDLIGASLLHPFIPFQTRDTGFHRVVVYILETANGDLVTVMAERADCMILGCHYSLHVPFSVTFPKMASLKRIGQDGIFLY